MGIRAVTLAVMLGACSTRTWTDPAECEAMSVGPEADECWAATATTLFKADPRRGTQLIDERVQDTKIKDFIWLTVTREVDPSSLKYCQRIQDGALKERCRVLVSRPHLHRELLRDAGVQSPGGKVGAGGGPAPGAGGPGRPATAGPPPGGGNAPPPRAKDGPPGPPPG